jgi:hypothetical protein
MLATCVYILIMLLIGEVALSVCPMPVQRKGMDLIVNLPSVPIYTFGFG